MVKSGNNWLKNGQNCQNMSTTNNTVTNGQYGQKRSKIVKNGQK